MRFGLLPFELMMSAQIWIKHPFISALHTHAVHPHRSALTGKRETEKSEAKTQQSQCIGKKGRKFESVGVQMDWADGEGKLIKMEARLMFVGGTLMHSGGDRTPSSLHLFLAAHLWISASKP